MIYQWAVIGAGPAGIAAVGKLLDSGILPKEIIWIDPKFTVGDFGTHWGGVPSNTKVNLFLKFLNECRSFNYENCPHTFELNQLSPNKTCYLRIMAEPLQWVTHHLMKTVTSVQGIAETISLHKRVWNIQLSDSTFKAKNVVLAIGAEPKNLSYPTASTIPLRDAIDAQRIHHHIKENDTIGVFGSSHSAILVLKNLVESNVKHIINFYRSPLQYAVYLQDWILFDDSGLKGSAADWAREHIDGDLPKNLTRIIATEENIEHHLPMCDKICYAIGFERRLSPVALEMRHLNYIEQCGIIAPGLFGFGIAFPEAKVNPLGILEYRVGLWKFMEYLQNVLPIWLKYPT